MKNITPRKTNIIFIAIAVVAILLIASAEVFDAPAMVMAGLGVFVLAVIFRIVFYRCPHCGVYLDRSSGKYCPHCGELVSEEEDG